MTAIAQKPHRGMGMEGSVARWYEKTTRKDIAEFRKLAARLGSLLPVGGDVLEIAPGPGFLAIEMARDNRLRVTGLDISKTFVEIAERNAAQGGVRVDFRQGNASQMPFAPNSFDLLVCRAAFKNFTEPVNALSEIQRVLRPGGTALIIDLRRDATMAEIGRYVDGLGLNVLNRVITRLTFRFMLLKRAYSAPQLQQMLEGIGFTKTEVRTNEIGLEACLTK